MHNDNKVIPLHVMLPETSPNVKCYGGQTTLINFLIEDGNKKRI